VSGCHTHGALLGGYVLGALEPAEMEAMRQHLESCPQCAREERKLAGLPAMLDTIEPGDVPPPQLSPELEEQVLDRFVRERRQSRRPSAERWRRVPVLAAASGIAAALLVGLVVLLVGGGAEDSAYAWSSLKGRGAAADAQGYARLTSVDAGTHVSLQARRLPGRQEQFELWCVRTDGRWVSGGTFQSRADGRAAAELTAAVAPGDYHVIVITTLGAGPEPGAPVLRGKLTY
jgi:anti-sigma-K factor RskA